LASAEETNNVVQNTELHVAGSVTMLTRLMFGRVPSSRSTPFGGVHALRQLDWLNHWVSSGPMRLTLMRWAA